MSDESDIEDGIDDGSADESPFLNGFIDAEAIESDDFDESESESGSDESDGEPSAVFSRFMELPPELRERVWELSVPDLKEHRVFTLMHMRTRGHDADELWETTLLPQQTAPARAMLGTHSESRAIALKHYPDTIDIRGGRGILRFHSERDVILLAPTHRRPSSLNGFISLFSNVKYLAFSILELDESHYPIPLDLYRPDLLPNLKATFLCNDHHAHSKSKLGWCASDSVHQYSTREVEMIEDVYAGEELTYLYCWPDLEKTLVSGNVQPRPVMMNWHNQPVWPMVTFDFAKGLDRYQKVCKLVSGVGLDEQDDSSSSESDSDGSTEDEYESDGIDDATIDNDSDESGDEDDLVVQSGSEEEEEAYEDEEENVSVFNGFSPLRQEEEGPELHVGDDVGIANFSSLEPESPNHDGNESSLDVSDEEPVQKTVRQKRRIVVSDDEHDSEEESDQMPSRPAKRSRIVLSDTEDEDNDDGDQVVEGHGSRPAGESEDDEEEEAEDPDETEVEEPVKAKPMSIFEKLGRFRDENPVPQDSDDESHTEGSVGLDEFDDGSEARFPDDEAADELDPMEPGEAVMDEYSEGEGEEEW
ncbi:hypothetical protein Hte_008342 [Hypoxylon texense]